jgi:hypothetical protein
MSSENTVFTKTVEAGKRKYYLDVKRAKNNSLYLSIREVTLGETPEKNESRRLMVFDNAIKDFTTAFNETASHVPAREGTKPAEKAAV